MESTPVSKEDAKKRLSDDGLFELEDPTTAKDLSDMHDKDWPWHEEDGVKFIEKQVIKDALAMEVSEDLLGKRVMVHCLRQHAYPGHVFCYQPGRPDIGLVSL
ncbi:hypothetical protein QQX98_012438 [Neonectria punicea]|uniref:Uncharacterized protein n=1 Tax=Neonectria punicea TaxID=979145 RepID=A0ABR1GJ34_9HYPO